MHLYKQDFNINMETYYKDQFVPQYIIYLNIWGALSKTIVFTVNQTDSADDVFEGAPQIFKYIMYCVYKLILIIYASHCYKLPQSYKMGKL